MNMARVRGLRDSIARWNQIWIRPTQRESLDYQVGEILEDNEWECKVRFVGREYRWQEFREDLFAPGASYCTGRIVNILSLKRRVRSGLHGAFHQAPELDDGRTIRGIFESFASSWHVHEHLVEAAIALAGSTPRWSAMG